MSDTRVLVGLRLGIGAGSWTAPRLAGRLFGLNAAANPQLPYVTRLFGARDVALAVGLQLSSGPSRRLWLQLGILCDAADFAAGVLAGRSGELSKLSTALVTAPALAGVAVGVAALSAADESPAPAPAS
jgi:hypothetical protein